MDEDDETFNSSMLIDDISKSHHNINDNININDDDDDVEIIDLTISSSDGDEGNDKTVFVNSTAFTDSFNLYLNS